MEKRGFDFASLSQNKRTVTVKAVTFKKSLRPFLESSFHSQAKGAVPGSPLSSRQASQLTLAHLHARQCRYRVDKYRELLGLVERSAQVEFLHCVGHLRGYSTTTLHYLGPRVLSLIRPVVRCALDWRAKRLPNLALNGISTSRQRIQPRLAILINAF